MKVNYSIASHLMHSGLQLIWKRVQLKDEWTLDETCRHNKKLLDQVETTLTQRCNVKITEVDKRVAISMLLHSLQQNDPQYYYVLIHQDSFNQGEAVNSYDGGTTFQPAKPGERMTLNEAHDRLFQIQEKHRQILLHIDKRFWRDFPYSAE